jgi:hypothetical protein
VANPRVRNDAQALTGVHETKIGFAGKGSRTVKLDAAVNAVAHRTTDHRMPRENFSIEG